MRLELRLWLVLACAVVGGMAGYGLSFVEEAEHRAEAKVMVSSSSGNRVVDPLLPNLRELATSSLLATNVDSTLRLPGSPEDLRRRLRASTPRGTQTIAISVLDRDADRARQVAQEAATVFTQLVGSRLGDRKPSVTAVVLDPA